MGKEFYNEGMKGKRVLITAKNNFYFHMLGTVVEEYQYSVTVEFHYSNRSEKVRFYKNQVKEV